MEVGTRRLGEGDSTARTQAATTQNWKPKILNSKKTQRSNFNMLASGFSKLAGLSLKLCAAWSQLKSCSWGTHTYWLPHEEGRPPRVKARDRESRLFLLRGLGPTRCWGASNRIHSLPNS